MNKAVLSSYIVKSGYSHKQLAEKLGISANTFSQKYIGKSFFNTDEIKKLCKLLDIRKPAAQAEIFLDATDGLININGDGYESIAFTNYDDELLALVTGSGEVIENNGYKVIFSKP